MYSVDSEVCFSIFNGWKPMSYWLYSLTRETSKHSALFTEESLRVCLIAKTDSILCLLLNKLIHQFGGCYYVTKSTIKFMSLSTSVNICDMCSSKHTIPLNQIIGVCFTCDVCFCWGVMVPLKYSSQSLLLFSW